MQKSVIKNDDVGIWCVCNGGKVWLPAGELPQGRADDFCLAGLTGQKIGHWQKQDVWLIQHESVDSDLYSVRFLLSKVDMLLFQLVGKAVQLTEFYRSHRFCGYCGQTMHWSTHEWCCLCKYCNNRYYPQIAPSIIVAVRKDDKILLANHVNHRNNIYTVLAGFVDVGETLEQAVIREVYEESHIHIKNIKYVASQPWPFPHSLMMAYTAEYDSGEIMIDKNELTDANWFHFDQLPLSLPEYQTIARRLIEDMVAFCRAHYGNEIND